MKLQYLGDSKDSFKWDYHDYLVSELQYPLLNIALMLTPDDGGNDGKTNPSLFPARQKILDFCRTIRSRRSIESIKEMPSHTDSSYKVEFHKSARYFEDRNEYFTGFNCGKQILFIDPDNGFEPERTINNKHVSYQDISNVLDQLHDESVVSVFQHHRRISFPKDYARIKARLKYGYSTAIYWHSLMFVLIAKSEAVLDRVRDANEKYALTNQVDVVR